MIETAISTLSALQDYRYVYFGFQSHPTDEDPWQATPTMAVSDNLVQWDTVATFEELNGLRDSFVKRSVTTTMSLVLAASTKLLILSALRSSTTLMLVSTRICGHPRFSKTPRVSTISFTVLVTPIRGSSMTTLPTLTHLRIQSAIKTRPFLS